MAQLKVKQISDFVAAVGTIHNGVVGTGTATAIGGAKSEAISSAVSADAVVLSSAKSYADVAESDAVATASADATSKANAAKSEAIAAAALDATSKADGALAGAKSYSDIQKGRIDALLLDAEGTLDTFKEISDFITTLDTADITGLTAAISTGDSTAISTAISADAVVLSSAKSYADAAEADAITSANGYTDGRETIIEKAFADADIVVDTAAQGYASDAESNANAYADGLAVNYDGVGSAAAALASAKTYADTAESDAIASAEAKDVVRASAAATALSNAISTEVLDRNAAILVLDNDLQGQIDALSGVNSDEVIALFLDKVSFDAGKVFNLNGGHVAVFVNGLQIHEAGEGVDGWSSENGQVFTVAGLGYELEADDHIVVSGTLA